MRPTREEHGNSRAAYFVSTQTAGRKPFFRHENWARLMIATLSHYALKDFTLHAYVIMPDHLHILITPRESLEKTVQLIKGGFSFRARRELSWRFDIWQPGFTDHRIRDEEDWKQHLEYIRKNPIEAKLVNDPALYEFMGFPESDFPEGLKPSSTIVSSVRAEARTLQSYTTDSPSLAKIKEEDYATQK
jgi:putative transposase